MNSVDMHTHTTASDGMSTPSELVLSALKAGLAGLAITDHDTVAGIPEAMEAGKACHMQVIPGVEISTVHEGIDIHVLGYWIHTADPLFLQRLKDLRGVRNRRNQMILQKLEDLGVPVTMEELKASLQAKKGKGETIGRPHIAEVMVQKGYVKHIREAFDLYLASGSRAYVNLQRITPETAIQWIHEAGGAAVLAHPGLYRKDEMIDRLIKNGLDGIEAYHSDHSTEDEARYARMAAKNSLIATAGSDYHGERNGQIFHGRIGSRSVSMEVAELLKNRSVEQ